MKIAMNLLKADRVGVRELKSDLSKRLNRKELLVVTDHGAPAHVIVPYEDMLELVDLLDEATDSQMVKIVSEARAAISKSGRGIPVQRLFSRQR